MLAQEVFLKAPPGAKSGVFGIADGGVGSALGEVRASTTTIHYSFARWACDVGGAGGGAGEMRRAVWDEDSDRRTNRALP